MIFKNVTTKELYTLGKKGITFEYVPNTAVGCEHERCYITSFGHKYLLSAQGGHEYYAKYMGADNNLSLWFRADGDEIIIHQAINNRRIEKADKYLKKYQHLVSMFHSCIKYDKIVGRE